MTHDPAGPRDPIIPPPDPDAPDALPPAGAHQDARDTPGARDGGAGDAGAAGQREAADGAAGETSKRGPFGRLKLGLRGAGGLGSRIRGRARRTHPEDPCRNCGDTSPGAYCRSCGQRKLEVRVSLRRMLLEAVEDQLLVNATLPRTLKGLFFHPGCLTREYVGGRIVSYVPPFRLYLVASLIFFVTVRLVTDLEVISREIDREVAEDTLPPRTAADSARRLQRDSLRAAARAVRDSIAARTGQRQGARVQTSRRSGAGFDVELDSGRMNINLGPDTTRLPRWLKPLGRRLQASEDRLEQMTPGEAVRTLIAGAERNAPTGMFLMMPVFALILKLLYARRKRFYVEHFVFALHVHAFAFLLFTMGLLVRNDWLQLGAFLWFVGYLYWAMKTFYAQGWFKTLLKFAFLSFSYVFLVTLGFMITLTLTALTV
ncbi:MAG TPA: DUF3667 domain-containing protein [Longimicrobium sp.]|nr:DUF3667 domain-containing protein [Longimicrobium sp.]